MKDPTFWILARASGLTAYVLITFAGIGFLKRFDLLADIGQLAQLLLQVIQFALIFLRQFLRLVT